MPHARRFRFGVEMVEPFEGLSWVESAQELEALGYSTLFVPDHLHEGFGPITAMATAAMATTSLVVASMVFAADVRPRRCWPASSRLSMCSRVAGWRWGWVPGTRSPTTSSRVWSWTHPASVWTGSSSRCACCAGCSLTSRSPFTATTTGSPSALGLLVLHVAAGQGVRVRTNRQASHGPLSAAHASFGRIHVVYGFAP